MNNQSSFNEDLLRHYVSPEKIEEAPAGFTSKVMSQIRSEAITVPEKEPVWKKYMVPGISVLITLLLITSAFLIPEDQIDTISPTVLNLIKNLQFSIPRIDFCSMLSLTLPSVTIYTIIGIGCLSIFDKALSGIFKRR